MGIEIERKFLVDGDHRDWGPSVTPLRAWEIRQGYVTPPGSDPEVRVRHARPVEIAGPDGTGTDRGDEHDPGGAADGAAVTRQLTTKAATGTGASGGVTRIEVEVDVDDAQFRELWDVTTGRRIEKLRTEYALDDATGRRSVFTVDRFHGALAGLQLAEIEFDGPEASGAFVPPSFLRLEVTDDGRYRNAELAVQAAPPAPPRAGGPGGPTAA